MLEVFVYPSWAMHRQESVRWVKRDICCSFEGDEVYVNHDRSVVGVR